MNCTAKTFILVSACLWAGINASAQGTARILKFENPVIEIDTVRYDAGPVKVRFVCTNISDSKVSILDVHSQCGCAVPAYSHESIAPGARAYVDVVLNPEHLFAEQNRHLTVIATNGDYRKFNTITIHGYVARDVTEAEVRYPYELLPGLRSDAETVGMRLSEKGETSVREFTIYNDSGAPLDLKWTSGSRRVKAELPATLAPGEAAKVRVSVSTAGLPKGEYRQSLVLTVSGVRSCEIPLKGAVK